MAALRGRGGVKCLPRAAAGLAGPARPEEWTPRPRPARGGGVRAAAVWWGVGDQWEESAE